MDEFLYMGDTHLREHNRRVERVNQRAWMIEDTTPETQPRRRFPRVRGR
jgi:hypothetical protein